MEIKTHRLKTWPVFFEAVECGTKFHEIRIDDRGYEVGDILVLQEWDVETADYTGRAATRRVTNITRFSELSANMMKNFGLNPCFPIAKRIVVMSIMPIDG